MQLLLSRGVDINARRGPYDTALRAASWEGHEKLLHTLLDKGADVNIQCGHYGTALQATLTEGHIAVVQLLLDRGADIGDQVRNQRWFLVADVFGQSS